jgi:hypothetical protein
MDFAIKNIIMKERAGDLKHPQPTGDALRRGLNLFYRLSSESFSVAWTLLRPTLNLLTADPLLESALQMEGWDFDVLTAADQYIMGAIETIVSEYSSSLQYWIACYLCNQVSI